MADNIHLHRTPLMALERQTVSILLKVIVTGGAGFHLEFCKLVINKKTTVKMVFINYSSELVK